MPTASLQLCSELILQRRCWTPLLAGLALVACGSGGADVAPAPAQTPAPAAQTLSLPAGYRLVWSDEFEQAGLPDPAKWVYDTGMNKQGWHNKELQYYSHARAENSVVQDGKLVISARLESLDKQADWGGQRYSSARLITAGKADWTYGFFEIRAKLPCGVGSWPAIWMLASQGEWPAGGELDIMEQVGKEPAKVFSTVHTTAGSGAHGKGGETQVPDACSAFHNYQMHWTAEQVSFGIDGKTHAVYPNPKTGKAAWPFDAPQFLILNIAIGGDLGGPVDDAALPIRMEVEHVRIYQQAK
ncbi:glycoside hydrolase family 16 protein [Paucibacter sp. TC2R-5]|uniref:glycoside hydrolase family 16 protein n=1 Tax=Paucibacter sp. TC2R-5 TaxID=2893555 RepID=UPI0021E38238|nr:glycoside hydrolase family 16 protein [Paucibacter sp. TC2R-5]MCV2358664.1 glycoside hydrolase family 16 protein [Paucibacter sp. TC2R-5]